MFGVIEGQGGLMSEKQLQSPLNCLFCLPPDLLTEAMKASTCEQVRNV